MERLYKVSSPCLDDHQFEQKELESVGESEVCSQIVLKYLYLTRIGRPDILWSVNRLARAVTKWTQACDRRLARLISHIHHTSEFQQYCHVGNTAQPGLTAQESSRRTPRGEFTAPKLTEKDKEPSGGIATGTHGLRTVKGTVRVPTLSVSNFLPIPPSSSVAIGNADAQSALGESSWSVYRRKQRSL